MYCSNCGKPVNDMAKFCSNCGTALKINLAPPKIQTQSEEIAKPTPMALIATTWILIAIDLFPIREIGETEVVAKLILGFAILICSIFLIFSKNGIGKINGWFVLVIWIVTFLYGFFIGFFYSFFETLLRR